MKRSMRFSLHIFVLFVFTGIPVVSIFGQSINYKIYDENVGIVSESIRPKRELKSIEDQFTEITYTFPGFSVSDMATENDIYQILRIDGFGLSLNTGKPSLPVRTEKVALPPNTKPKLSVIASEYIELEGYNLFPAQEMTPDGSGKKFGFKKSAEAYRSDEFFPKDLGAIEDIQIYRNIPLTFLQIHPVQYNAFRKKIRIYKSLTIRIEYVSSIETVSPKVNNNSLQNYSLVNNTVINPSNFSKKLINAKAATIVNPVGYIIVTTPKFEAAADSLARWKGQLGYRVRILMQDTWSVPEVKNAVEDAYSTMDPTPSYLVILGDQEDVPDYYYENIYLTPLLPVYSTNYYACMDGSNDYMPEMAHGRISVNSGSQAVKVIQKIINFERNPPSDPTFYTKGMHAGYFQDSARDGTSDKRYAHTSIEIYEYLESQGYESDLILYTEPDVTPQRFNSYYSGNTTIPSKYLKENGFAWDGDKYDILNSLNDGRIYAFHRDHGLQNGWVSPQIDINDFNALTNGNETPIIFSINCASGLFTKPEPIICFSEKLLRYENGGAVGIVSATEETRSGYNDGLMMGMIDAIWPDPGLIPDLGDGGEAVPASSTHEPIYTMGDVMIQGLIRMTENWDPSGWADRDQFHLYHYFGDPAMQFWTQVPTAIAANHTNTINTGTTSIDINYSNCTGGLATVCAGNELLSSVRLSDGTGTINLPKALGKNIPEIILTISKHNYIPYIAKLKVDGANLPAVPDQPGNLMAQLINGATIQLTWEDNAINETSYEIERSINAGDFTQIASLPQNNQIYNDNISIQGSTYRYRVKASNSSGSSDYIYSNPVDVPAGSEERIAGYDEIFSTAVYNDHRRAQQITMPEDGTITKVVMYHGGGGGSLRYAVYSNTGNKPGDLLAVTAVTSLNSSKGWQEVELETPVFVSANTIVWLAWVYEYSPAIYYTSGGPGRAHSGDTWSTQMPLNFGSSSISNYTYSIYANYTSSTGDLTPAAPSIANYSYDEDIPVIRLGWKDNSDNEDGFTLERKMNSEEFETLITLEANDTAYSDYTVVYDQDYQYRIMAFNANGNSDYSGVAHINTSYVPPSAPNAPTSLAGIFNGSGKEISLTWTDNSQNEELFILERKTNSEDYEPLETLSADQTEYIDNQIEYNQIYSYRILASNSIGSSGYSNEFEVSTEYDPVPDPGEFGKVGYDEIFNSPVYNDYRRAQCVEMPENGTLLSIAMFHGGGGGSVLYAIYDDNGGRPGNRLAVTAVASTNSTDGWQEIDLETPVFVEQGTRIWLAWVYQYSPRLFYTTGGLGRAHSGEKWSSQMPVNFGSASISGYRYSIHAIYQAEGAPSAEPPAQPAPLSASFNATFKLVSLNWTDNSNNEDGFIVERSANSGGFDFLASVPANTILFNDETVDYNKVYDYRVHAINSAGNSPYSNIESVNTTYTPPTPPEAPTSLSGAYHAEEPSIILTWVDNSDNETSFTIQRKINNQNYQMLTNLAANSINYTDNSISYGNTYEYKVFASNSVGNSNSSNSIQLEATLPEIPPSTPQSLTANYSNVIPMIQLSWTDNSDNEDGFILERSIEGGSYQLLSTLNVNETEYYDFDIEYLTDYTYRVYGFNVNGNSLFSNVAEIFTAQPGNDPIVAGNTDVLPMKVYSSYRRAQQVTIPENGSIESITMYHGPGKGYLLFGVYADNNNAPGALLESTPATPNSPVLGWQTVELINTVSVAAGQKVWLAWSFTNGTDIYYGNGTPGRAHSNEFWTGQLPDPFGPASFTNYIYSIYLTMNPGGTPKSGETETGDVNANIYLVTYPEPVSDNIFYFSMQNIVDANFYHLEIIDITGRIIQKRKVWIEPGVEYHVQLPERMDSNLLLFRLYNEKHTHIKRIVLSKSN